MAGGGVWGKCQVCQDTRVKQIDTMLMAYHPGGKLTWRGMGHHWGIDPKTLQRHKARHLARNMIEELGPLEVTQVRNRESLVERVEMLLARAERIIQEAERARELGVALGGLREARGCVELLARLAGELQAGLQIHIHPQWIQLRSVLVQALGPYPEAKGSVVAALKELEVVSPEVREEARRAAYQQALGVGSHDGAGV